MIDLKKEIDLGALLRTRKSKGSPQPKRAAGRIPREERMPSELVGLEIGSSHITVARVGNNGSRKLLQLARQALSPGIVSGGEVRDPVGLAAALEELFVKHDLPRRGVRLGLANTRVGVRLLEVEGIDDEAQLENAISFRAHELLSVPVEDAAIDYHVVGNSLDENGQPTRRIVVVVAYRDSIDRFVSAADEAGIQIAGIDLEAFALLRAVCEPTTERLEAAVVAACIGHERTTLAISDGNACEFARVLEWGGSSVTAALARALKISGQEAEELKHALSLDPGAAPPPELTEARSKEALGAVRHEFQELVRELLSSLRFYQSQQGSLPIGDVVLCGGTANMTGLAGELERELGLQVRIADPLSRVVLGEAVDLPEAAGSFAVAIGLGIEDQ
jgi:type IV pilus assembly protein PilM